MFLGEFFKFFISLIIIAQEAVKFIDISLVAGNFGTSKNVLQRFSVSAFCNYFRVLKAECP